MPRGKVYILRGLPGAGKSTFAEQVLRGLHTRIYICSADKYFIDGQGVYRFEPSRLAVVHAMCRLEFDQVMLLAQFEMAVVVDNTNLRFEEFAPYAAKAIERGFDLEIITFLVDPEVAWERNVHGVPKETVCQTMSERLQQGTKDIPCDWSHTLIIQ